MGLPPNMVLPYNGPLFRGMKGDSVKELQRNLNTLNDWYEFHTNKQGDALVINETSIFDDATIRILKDFQKFFDLPPSGLYDWKTHDMLQYKNWNARDSFGKMHLRRMQEEARIKEAEKLARSMAKINKLFKDGKFGN